MSGGDSGGSCVRTETILATYGDTSVVECSSCAAVEQ